MDLYSFTAILKARLEQPARERIVEMMWRLVYADGTVHEFEDNAVWRVAELLAVPNQVRMALKRAVRGGPLTRRKLRGSFALCEARPASNAREISINCVAVGGPGASPCGKAGGARLAIPHAKLTFGCA